LIGSSRRFGSGVKLKYADRGSVSGSKWDVLGHVAMEGLDLLFCQYQSWSYADLEVELTSSAMWEVPQ
jgi:hypothetical protein